MMINTGTAAILALITLGVGGFAGVSYKQIEIDELLANNEHVLVL